MRDVIGGFVTHQLDLQKQPFKIIRDLPDLGDFVLYIRDKTELQEYSQTLNSG